MWQKFVRRPAAAAAALPAAISISVSVSVSVSVLSLPFALAAAAAGHLLKKTWAMKADRRRQKQRGSRGQVAWCAAVIWVK